KSCVRSYLIEEIAPGLVAGRLGLHGPALRGNRRHRQTSFETTTRSTGLETKRFRVWLEDLYSRDLYSPGPTELRRRAAKSARRRRNQLGPLTWTGAIMSNKRVQERNERLLSSTNHFRGAFSLDSSWYLRKSILLHHGRRFFFSGLSHKTF